MLRVNMNLKQDSYNSYVNGLLAVSADEDLIYLEIIGGADQDRKVAISREDFERAIKAIL